MPPFSTRWCLVSVGLVCVACIACAQSAEDEARAINDRRAHIGAVETQVALLRQQQTVEANATSVTMNATTEAKLGPVRATATAGAADAEAVALTTRVSAESTANVAAAQLAAQAEATRVVNAVSIAATQTASAQQVAARQAAYLVAWKERRDAAARFVWNCSIAGGIASDTDSVEAARAAARIKQVPEPIGTCKD